MCVCGKCFNVRNTGEEINKLCQSRTIINPKESEVFDKLMQNRETAVLQVTDLIPNLLFTMATILFLNFLVSPLPNAPSPIF